MTTISNYEKCTLEELKQLGKEFFESIKVVQSQDEADQLFKCFSLAYLNAELKSHIEEVEAEILMGIVGKKMIDYELGPTAEKAKQAFADIRRILGTE
jgi:hypothetical protein